MMFVHVIVAVSVVCIANRRSRVQRMLWAVTLTMVTFTIATLTTAGEQFHLLLVGRDDCAVVSRLAAVC
jgi:hypothetical protein